MKKTMISKNKNLKYEKASKKAYFKSYASRKYHDYDIGYAK